MRAPKFSIRALLVVAVLALTGAGYTYADTVFDSGTGVSYTLTSTFAPETGTTNTYDVTLLVDASKFSGAGGATSGFLQAIALQFTGATSVTVDSSPFALSAPIAGGTNSSGCDGQGNFVCFKNLSATGGAVPGTYTFVFDVTTSLLSTSSDIKAVYNSLANGSGTFLGQTSMGITVQPVSQTPEPTSLLLFGTGILTLGMHLRRRLLA
jgi:hypothetical protein